MNFSTKPSSQAAEDGLGGFFGTSQHWRDRLERRHRGLGECSLAREHGRSAEVAGEHLGLAHIGRRGTKGFRNGVLDESVIPADAQIAPKNRRLNPALARRQCALT